ncbi:hypothetical protein ABB37_02897 [Leptomonas pyrrhocoris]|uniref:HYDIN/VesB/CFA65-like Ig-like domain-containing protein n=1 Tax=Leptomonas pyrrhocoris TaxID=157538 RepID=A0A0M9G665_LEPPY|nr:hypothetical protein ABB37_02897 [Leptomonas pyrrhocoris]KPA83213.1 hypothetical protein ABB37_02897 [Leptomonas pyrrhocoris]|eukprot:XP_015661652.1 hypothetical protein ABB37_02897 [Leptomonas pyrrhocoris]
MHSSASPASRRQLANSMPASLRGRSGGAGERDAGTQLASSAAAFSATGPRHIGEAASKDGSLHPHRPAAAKTGPTRITQQHRQQAQQDPHDNEKMFVHSNGGTMDAAAATRDSGAPATTFGKFGAAAAAAGAGGGASSSLASDLRFPFDVYPSTIIFDSYAANTTYTATLELKNRTAFNKHVRVDRPHACTTFELTAPRGAESSSKVAPGLSVSYTVLFTPTSSTKDYGTELVVRTEDDQAVIVPVRAYASRGCLQLPSSLVLKDAPMKGSSTTPLFLRNISERSCVWRAVIVDPPSTPSGSTTANYDAAAAAALLDSCPPSACFSITPHNGVVEPLCAAEGNAVTVAPVTLHFRPDPALAAAGTCHGLLRFFLGPEGDVVQDVWLSAQAVELHGIVLEETEVTLADTYVTTERRTVVRVRNDSDETVAFAWKTSFRDTAGEVGDESDVYDNDADGEDATDGAYGVDGKRRWRPTRPTAATMHKLLSSKHYNRTTNGDSTAEDPELAPPPQQQQHEHNLADLYDGDESFQIQPLSGVLYGRGVREFTITFNPHLAVLYESIAYLDVTGSVQRLPLLMRGHGVGPQCKLDYNRLDIGDVYLNAVHEYFVTMENTSAIECQFVVMPPAAPSSAPSAMVESAAPPVDFASKFKFTPSHGSLAPGESVKLKIVLRSDRIGSFAESFHIHMQGAMEEVPLLLRGRVLGPHFQCDVDDLDFGNVSYNMKHTRTMNIENTSPIPMHYALHLPDDCAYASDFVITPAEGVIAPRSAEVVQVLFHSRTVGDYETALLVEVADVGDVLDAIPLKATCMVPTLYSSTTELTYGGVFVGYPTTLNVSVSNDTALTGMFDLLLLNGDALTDVVMVELPVSSEHDDGVHWIAPHHTLQLPVTLTALKPGRLHFSLALRVLGHDVCEPPMTPLTILVSAVASGPHVEVQPSTVQFGVLDVLAEEVRELTLKNTSPVPAPFALVFDRYGTVNPPANSAVSGGNRTGSVDTALLAESTLPFPRVPVFSVEPAEGTLEPHSSFTVHVRAKPDEAIAFVDTLRLRRTLSQVPTTPGNEVGNNGTENAASLENDVAVSVKVTGQGVPIIADRSLESIELGDVLTTVPVMETVTLHNYGRREQELQWQNIRGSKVKEGESPITFNYKPERASIAAGGSVVFTLCGSATEVGTRMDTFTLKQSGTFKEVLRSTVKATFIAPTLSCSSRAIVFEYANHAPTAPAATAAPSLVKSLTMKNITSKVLVIALRIKSANAAPTTTSNRTTSVAAISPKGDVPFLLEGPTTVTLSSGESYVVGVRCNPLYRGDNTSHTAKGKLQLSFDNHDRKEFVSLSAVLRFPSLVLNPSVVVDFGTILTNTEQRRSIELYNPSHDLPATFCWTLRPQTNDATATAATGSPIETKSSVDGAVETTLPCKSAASRPATCVKVNGFDVIPFAGTLLPGEKRVVEVAYQGTDMGVALATAVCHVEGGPMYTMDLRAAANVVQALCDKSHLDFGRLPYFQSVSKVVTLTNTTQVHVPWQVDLSRLRHPECLKVSPMSGVLRDKARLQVTFSPQVPDAFEEEISVRIGHLDPRLIHVVGSGYMCSVALATTTTATAVANGSGASGSGRQNMVHVYRAPFGAFTSALQDVESRLASTASPSSAAPAELPTVLQRDWPILEAERLAFCRAIHEKESIITAAAEGVTRPPVFLTPRTMRRSSGTALRSSGSGMTKLALARYIVDFGHLTRHDVRKTKLTIANPSAEGVSVVLDAKEFANLPVSVDPVKGFKMAGHETTTITLTMDATQPESMVPHGENTHEFTLDIKNGPAVVIECRCYVATPSLRAKEKEVDFGAVLLGEVKVLPLVLTNPEAVTCPWRVTCKELIEGDAAHQSRFGSRLELRDDVAELGGSAATAPNSDEKGGPYSARRSLAGKGNGESADGAIPEFWVKQDHGVVPASGTLTIEVYYAPKNFRAKSSGANAAAVTSAAQLKFRCGTGSASSFLTIKLTGSGEHYQLGLSTEQLHLPPVPPQQVLHESVTITNDEDHPVEIFNLALDSQHANEVKLLRRALESSAAHEVLLPHIEAGDYLPDTLLDSVFDCLRSKSDALTEVSPVSADAAAATGTGESADADGAAGRNGNHNKNKAVGKSRGSVNGAAQAAAAGGSSNTRGSRKESRRASVKSATGDAAVNPAGGANTLGDAGGVKSANAGSSSGAPPSLLMLVGPPRSGKTSVAQQWLSKSDGRTTLVDVDALVRAEAERDDTANAAVARCLLTRAAEEEAAAAAVVSLAGNSPRVDEKDVKAAISCEACVPTLIRDLLQSFLNRCIVAERSRVAAATAALDELNDVPRPNTTTTTNNSSPAAAPLRFVVDGLKCGVLANQWTLYELISSVCATLHIPVHIVSLHVSTPTSNVRAARALAAHHAARVAAASVTPLDEAAFEALSKDDREDYNRRLKYMNDCRRDLHAAQQEERDWAAQLPHTSVQEELEESVRQQQAEAALEATVRPSKTTRVAPARRTSEDRSAGQREPEWKSLDAAAQFDAWYRRFLQKCGCPPNSTNGTVTGAAAAPAASTSTRPTGNAKAAAAAANALAQEAKASWSQVLRVIAETREPTAVADDVVHQLAQKSGSVGGALGATAHGSVDPKSTADGTTAATATTKTETTLILSALASAAGSAPQGRPLEAFESRVGEWFYLNEARLRYWTAERVLGARSGSVSMSSPSGEGASGEARAVSAESAVTENSSPTTNRPANAGDVNAEDASHHNVRFFSTVEREVVPVKKTGSKKKSMPSFVLQKEEVTRWTLPAHSSVTLSLEFCSDHVGRFVEKCIFGVVGSLQQLCLTVSATIALPDISRDPKDIFPVVRPRIGVGSGGAAGGGVRRMPKVYATSKKLFDFGALLIAPPPTAKGRRRSGGPSSSTLSPAEKAALAQNTAGRPANADHVVVDAGPNANTPFEETLSFMNREQADAEVTLSFVNDKEKTFTVTPTSFTLRPGATQRVQLRANPEKAGDFSNTLMASIKDNPVPWKVEVMCTGARPSLSVNGVKESLEVDFGRLVLRRSVGRSFTLANEGVVPLSWRLVPVQEVSTRGEKGGGSGGGSSGAAVAGSSVSSASAVSQLPAELQCSTMEGVLEENEVQTLDMTFAPTHPCLHNRVVNFLVSEVGQPQSVYETIPMTVKAEGYDVVVEWTRELQLGVLHVGEEKREAIRIMNKCPYDVGYQLRMPRRLQKVLTLSAPSGTLRGMMGHKDAAIATIDVVARMEKEGELPAKLSVMEVAFFDVEKQELLYPLQTIPVFGEAWYTKYVVQPPSVSFGSCVVGQPRERTFQLTNTGRFPLEYSLFNYCDAATAAGTANAGSVTAGGSVAAAQGGDAATHATGGAEGAPVQRKSMKFLKAVETDIAVGAFTCRPGQGVVPVGGTQLITVSTVPSQQNRIHETIGVRVAQSGPELERYGTPVEVSAYPAAPSIAANLTSSADVETIFEEQRVVYRLEQLPKGARAYSKEERVFSFGTVLVGQRCEERFRIANSSPLSCSVTVQLDGIAALGNSGGGGVPGTATGSRSVGVSSNSGGGGANAGDAGRPDGFDLSVEGKSGASPAQSKGSAVRFSLPPFESRFVTVGFTPSSLSRLQAQLIATVDSVSTSMEERGDVGQQLRFGLYGEGTLPTVDLVLPWRYTSADAGVSQPAVITTAEHLRGADGLAGGEKRKGARRRQGGVGSVPNSNLHTDGHTVGPGTAEVLELPVTRVDAVSKRNFTVRNTGCVEAHVQLELISGSAAGDEPLHSTASLSMSPGTVAGAQPQEPTEPRRQLEVVVPAGGSEEIEVIYAPSQVESTTTRLRLTLAHNPFEDKEIQVVARSFKGEISFEGIDPASSDYIDVGDCYLGVDKTCSFTARNNTDSLVRYVWEVPETVRITPSIGHLPAGATRAFTATVRSPVEGLGRRVCCALQAQSIMVQPANTIGGAMAGMRNATAAAMPSATASEWDNSLQSPKWVLRGDDTEAHPNAAAYLSAAAAMMGRRNLKQVMEAVPEPAYSVVDEVCVTQPLTMGFRCSVPTYQCHLVGGSTAGMEAASASMMSTTALMKELKAISFPHTYLLQTRVAVVRVINTGSVALPYSCSISASDFPSNEKETPTDPTASTAEAQTTAPSWTAAQLSAAAAAGGITDSPSRDTFSEPHLTADFGVTSSAWTRADAAPSDVHVVEAGSQVDLNVEFTPRTVGLLGAELLLRFPHSEPREVQVSLQGVAECPLVHFKVPPPPPPSSVLAKSLQSGAESRSPSPVSTTGGAQGQEQPEPLVVEFLARGLHTKATVRFPVVNPTSGSYNYEWLEESGSAASAAGDGGSARVVAAGGAGMVSGSGMSPFRCLTSSGVVAAGRSVEAAFEFFADALGVRKSDWTFRIPGRATIPFRLIGNVVEPNVYFHASKVDFEHVQVGTRVERAVVLENCDDVAFSFAWDKLSLEGTATFLSVKPLRGTIAPRERLAVLLSFAPQEEMEYNVPLRCTVKKSSLPLSINVKGVGICVHDALHVEPATATAEDAGEESIPVLRGQPLTLDLARVQVSSTAARRFVLRNTGTYLLRYRVDIPTNPCVHFDHAEGTVEAGQSAEMLLQYTPIAEETLKQCRLIFRIEGSVAYKVSLRAVAFLPRLRLNFDRYDFGPRFIAAFNSTLSASLSEAGSANVAEELLQAQRGGSVSQELQLTNVESETISVECGMATQNAWLKLDCTSLVVRPKETARLKLTFAPTEIRYYEDVLELCLNKVHTTRLPIAGEGVAPRVEVAEPFAEFGTVRVGEPRSVAVKLQCLSKVPTPVSFSRTVDEDLQRKGVSIVLPGQGNALSSMLLLKPKEIISVSVVFAPTHRMSEFNREMKMLVCGVELPFVSVSGSCADAEVHLDTSHIEFRDVVLGASATRKVVILNSGDVSQKFSWISGLQQLKPAGEWSITPSTGFVRAHTEVPCEVRYTPNPNVGGNSGRRKAGSMAGPSLPPATSSPPQPSLSVPRPTFNVKLELDSAPPVFLSVDANAVTRPAATETVSFACRARESDVKTIEVENATDQPWSAEPVVDNALWSCPSMVTLKPLAKAVVAVTYNPTRSTVISNTTSLLRGNAATTGAAASAPAPAPSAAAAEGIDKTRQGTTAAPPPLQHQKDRGFFFIPLPDGTGRCVALEGTAEPAGPAGPLQHYDAVAHVGLPLRFQVHNWSLSNAMRFRKEVEWTSGPVMESGESGAQIAMRVHESDTETPAPKKGGDVASRATAKVSYTGASKKGPNKVGGARKSAAAAAAANAAVCGAIEIAPSSSSEFSLLVTPLREGTFRGVVRFYPIDKNGAPLADEEMRQFFEVEINAEPAPAAAPTVVELRAAIRDLATFNIPLTNPLAKPVEFTFKSNVVDGDASTSPVSASAAASALEGLSLPTSVVVPAQSRGKAAVTFFPLLYKKTPAAVQCAVSSADLGTSEVYLFRLTTTTSTAAPERPTQVVCPLGQHVSFVLRFTHYWKANTEFAIRLGGEVPGKAHSSFSRVAGGGGGGQGASVKASAAPPAANAAGGYATAGSSAPKGQEVVVEFSYEPSELGEERETIEFVSPAAGSYVFPIVANCIAPQRQGPFSTRAGQNLQLPFKNVFNEPVSISVTSDSAAFVPAKKTEVIPAHKAVNVVLQCKADEDKDVVRGRVSITCTPPGKSTQQTVEWLYYVEMTGSTEHGGAGKQSGRKK